MRRATHRRRRVAGDRRGPARLARRRPRPRHRVADPDGLLPFLHATRTRPDRPVRPVALVGMAPLRPRLDTRLTGLSDARGRAAPGDHRLWALRPDGSLGATEASLTSVG